MGSREKIRLYFLIELLIWLFIIMACVGIFRYKNIKKIREYKTYQVFMQDVDGLIVGSPVRMMGVPIGYISNVKIVQDHVYVKLVITEKEFTIPKGVIATVEFNGLGGSKSLELYPPDDFSKASGNIIAIKQTNRLGAALGLLNDMFDKIGSIMVRCQLFSEGVAEIHPASSETDGTVVPYNPVEDASKSVNQVGNIIDTINKRRLEFKDKMKGIHHE